MKQASLVVALLLIPGIAHSQSAGAKRPAGAEVDAVEDLFVERFIAHWQAANPKGLASLWHEDGDWMSLIGSRRMFQGRDQIEQVWSIGLQGRETPEARALAIEIDSVKMLSPDLAQVDMVMTFGHESTGTVREAMLAIVRRGEAGWKILSSRVARISSAPSR